MRAFFSCLTQTAILSPLSKLKRRPDSIEATQWAPRDLRCDLRGERHPLLALESRPDSPGAALPVGLPSQPPRPLARSGSALRPPFQAEAPSSFFLFSASAPRRLTGLPANGGGGSGLSRSHFLFPPAGCARRAGTGWSPGGLRLSSLDPHAAPGARNAVHRKKGLLQGMAPYSSQ